LCEASEKVAFACSFTNSKKQVAVCVVSDKSATYRFGKPGKVELKFPEGAFDKQVFKRTHLCWRSGCENTFEFENKGFAYELSDTEGVVGDINESVDSSEASLAVSKGKKAVATLSCDMDTVLSNLGLPRRHRAGNGSLSIVHELSWHVSTGMPSLAI
jgi:hypothetical protein